MQHVRQLRESLQHRVVRKQDVGSNPFYTALLGDLYKIMKQTARYSTALKFFVHHKGYVRILGPRLEHIPCLSNDPAIFPWADGYHQRTSILFPEVHVFLEVLMGHALSRAKIPKIDRT